MSVEKIFFKPDNIIIQEVTANEYLITDEDNDKKWLINCTAKQILGLCESKITADEIINKMYSCYYNTNEARIKNDVLTLLDQLQEKRIINVLT